MPSYCCAFGCQNKYFLGCGKTFHRLPKDPTLHQQWIASRLFRERTGALWINQDCYLHLSTLLLNLNCADNVPNINFNAPLDTNKLRVLLRSGDDVITRHWDQKVNKSSGLHFFDDFLIVAHFCDQSRYVSGFYYVKGSWWAVYLAKYKTFAYLLYDVVVGQLGSGIRSLVRIGIGSAGMVQVSVNQCYFSYGFSVLVSVTVVAYQLQLLFFSFYFYFS